MTDDFIRYGILGGAYAGIPDKIAALFKEGNIKEKIDRPLILNYLNGRKENWPKALDYISYYIELFRQWAYRRADGDKILLQEIDNYIKDLYEWLKQGREKGQLDDIEGRRLQLLKESLTEKLNEYVPERLILGGQESIDKLLYDIENSEHATTYPSRPSDTWYNAEIERLCLLSEKIKLLRKLVGKIHPEDANKYHYLHYLFEIMGDISSYIGVLERSRNELYASIGKVEIDIEQHFSKLDESIDNTNRDIKRHFSELKENLVAPDLAGTKQAEEQKEIPLLTHSDIKRYVDQIEMPIELLDFLKEGYELIYDSWNFGKEPSFFKIISECVFRIREKHLSLNLPPDPKGDEIVAYKNWCIDAQRIIDATTLTKTEPVSTNPAETKQSVPTAKNDVEKEFDCFEKLANALRSWKIDISGNKKDIWMHKWNINLQIGEHLKAVVTWLKLHKSYEFAEGFEKEFKGLFNDVYGFYEKLKQSKLDEAEIFHEQIPLLEDSAKQLADYVVNVKSNLCEKNSEAEQNTKEVKSQNLIPISQLIKQGEGHTVEFKETLEYSVREKKQDTNLNKECLKTIVAFLNTDGGTLLIGVRDSGEITGIERDLPYVQRKNEDGFQIKLRNLIKNNFTPIPSGKIDIHFEKHAKETICRVDVEPVNKNQIIHLGKDVYIRDGNITRKLEGRDLTDWIQQRGK